MTTTMRADPAADSDLWRRVCQGDAPAFETLVQRYQSLVCAVAYNACGDLALSEDVAQETFWAAWRERESLEEPARLRGWLCGIARNLGRNARRRAARPAESASPLNAGTEVAVNAPGPAEEMVSREEAALIWQTLEQIPDSYREPLILFYREQQPVAEIAAALDLSEDAVKQRLTRGRALLREQVAQLVEGVLQRTRPGRPFTVAVMAGLTVLSGGAKTALAGTGSATAAGTALKGVGALGSAGLLGGLLGSVLGLAGGWLGMWIPAQLAPTRREHAYLLRKGWQMFFVSVLFVLALVGGQLAIIGRVSTLTYLGFWAGWMISFWSYLLIELFRINREIQRIRAETAPTEPNDAPLRLGLNALTAQYRGRVYRSRWTLLGLPLIDINVSDPPSPAGAGQAAAPPRQRRIARGWIAIGDDARGVLLAIGSIARGFIAIGGCSLGVVSVGGVAVGLVAVGGAALGGLAIGGLGVGGLALGGLVLGWQAVGGVALGWEMACGGAAAAWQGAVGGAAFAHEFAVGGGAWALHANDAAAEELLLVHPLWRGWQWYLAHLIWLVPSGVVLLVMGYLGALRLMYRREKAG
jgi:RNA polymerase sigma factor (sigma-70 family)